MCVVDNEWENKMFTLKLEADSGEDIKVLVKKALLIANAFDITIEFEYSGVTVYITPHNESEDILDRYHADHYYKNYKPW